MDISRFQDQEMAAIPPLDGAAAPAKPAKLKRKYSHFELFADKPVTEDQWKFQRSWLRHLPEPARLVLVLLGLWPIVAWSVLVSLAVGLYYELGQSQHEGWPVAISPGYIQPFLLTSFALALLLVFRTNSSYDRWWEARKAFGMMYNCSRNMARLTVAWVAPHQPAAAAEILQWNSLLCAAACAFLRDDISFLDPYSDLLPPGRFAWMAASAQPPIAAMQAVSALVAGAQLSTYERVALEQQLSTFDISLGACERIRRQTIPMAYTRHTSRFIISYITFLPFGLWSSCSWLTLPIMAVITFLLVGIENIGVQIEEPMTVLPLKARAAAHRRAVVAVAGGQEGAARWAADTIGTAGLGYTL